MSEIKRSSKFMMKKISKLAFEYFVSRNKIPMFVTEKFLSSMNYPRHSVKERLMNENIEAKKILKV
ncbi:CLUMA_CG004064, isoform A [Clunio marinus]|uniref:CLUMA_CG004064, isoform A n=1 Tax=Clunio marinus TaxID=568069 RepID=A0A1J1HSE1_9DIPT|nr:CLUMA_CG004064, isoform A [Clunio marinus]